MISLFLVAQMDFIKYCEGLGIVPNPLPKRIKSSDVLSLNTFGLISANLYNFLPQMPYTKHRFLYRDFKMNQWLHGIDTHFFQNEYPLPIDGVGDLMDKLNVQNGIICTYHFGVYQLIDSILLNSRNRFALLVGADVFNNWKERYPVLSKILDKAAKEERFVLLNAEASTSLRQMYRLVKQGYSIVVYVDGIQGVSQGLENQLIQIPFLGQQIFVPKGAAALSHYFGVPMYPVLALRRTNRIEFKVAHTIFPTLITDRQQYCVYAMREIFSFLSTYVMHWPEQWTNWSLLHYFLKGILPLNRAIITGNTSDSQEYSLIKFQAAPYLMKKSDYKTFLLNDIDFECLLCQWEI